MSSYDHCIYVHVYTSPCKSLHDKCEKNGCSSLDENKHICYPHTSLKEKSHFFYFLDMLCGKQALYSTHIALESRVSLLGLKIKLFVTSQTNEGETVFYDPTRGFSSFHYSRIWINTLTYRDVFTLKLHAQECQASHISQLWNSLFAGWAPLGPISCTLIQPHQVKYKNCRRNLLSVTVWAQEGKRLLK